MTLPETAKDTCAITGYHAHVYYDAQSKPTAAALREAIEARFDVRLGRWHDRPVGPHPRWSYQVAFAPEVFAELVPWLALNRGDLTIFLHPETGDVLPDHRDHAIWLGDKAELDFEALK
ncbi:MAG: 4,5-dioxygenase [Kiloniellaceae bacterium]|nr:4,5-dioxygenase [Kiloniellaceae bacterium]